MTNPVYTRQTAPYSLYMVYRLMYMEYKARNEEIKDICFN